MTPNAALNFDSREGTVTAVDDDSKPTFDRVLALFESSPDTKPFDPAHVLVLVRLQRASKEHYAKILDGLLEGRDGGALPLAVIRGAQMLHRRIANALAQAASRLVNRPQLPGEQMRCAELALCSLRARADEIKWHAFEQTAAQPSSWQQTNQLMRSIESLGVERQIVDGDLSCTDAFAHCLLLCTLNVGILTPPQMELAQRWLAASARDLRVEPFFDPESHWYQIDLAADKGPERVSPAAAVADNTRFLAVAPLGATLARARSHLYAGKLSVGATPNRVVALHFGSFLDLAEKLWSQDFRRATWRGEREKVSGESIEVVLGFDEVMDLLAAEDADPERLAAASWELRDKSATGLGASLPKERGEHIPLGALIGFRHPGDETWQLGCVVRRIRVPDASRWSIGIKRLSASPVLVDLEPSTEGLQLETEATPDPAAAIYAPIETDGGRIDGVVIDADRFGGNNDFLLPTGGGAFRIRANRVIERGDRWIRIGFEVLGKR
jgi:hypothetical protein